MSDPKSNSRRQGNLSAGMIAAAIIAAVLIVGFIMLPGDRTRQTTTDTSNEPTITGQSQRPDLADPHTRPQDIPFPIPQTPDK